MSSFTIFLQTASDPTSAVPWASLGVGGVLAAMIFFFYRSDRKASEDRHTKCEERLEAAFGQMQNIVISNTTAMTRLADVIERK
jgi:hypothetical protein